MERAHRHHGRFCKDRRRAESGVFAIMFVPLLFLILGFYGLALDIGFVYNRKAELHGVAQGIALAAARELNGTAAGVSAALAKAAQEAQRKKVGYGRALAWSDAAIAFGSSPDGDAEWVGADAARAAPANRYYVKVDTRNLDQDVGAVGTFFIRILAQAQSSMFVSERAVAGRSAVNVVPLAICAMSEVPGAARTNPGPPATVELVEYGFRRGVGYDLMNLNPLGTTPANFVLDPEFPPGAAGAASNTSASTVAPFICTGRVWMTGVTGGAVRVGSPFPIDALYRELNARFEQYTGSVCVANGAPPDYNIKAFSHGASGGAAWMKARATHPGALRAENGSRLQTIADLPSPPAGTAPGAYGPLWAYAKAVKFADYVAGSPEPEAGYTPFATSDWPSLYPASPATESASYPSRLQPYQASTGSYYGKPSNDNLPISVLERRVLHVPLLACPVPAGSNVGAQVLAIGKFFMTVPATNASIHAEFAGILPNHKLTGQVILYP
ncbi:TadE/TadG family type IV pilus assembly protein [Telluria beijingensis]|uniref:TadE/TadG family type IV pilus assembly protein n=1 Tax=Telluria beijingensis TaxID=3068633 RepID=UPI002795C4A4|nr:TadE/TadG family type IV pilus assembly protein [Massilia sp. REN29]